MNINNFILSTYHDVLKFCEFLSNPKNSNIDLKIVLDYPQIFSAIIGEDNDDNTISMDNLEKAVEKIKLFNHDLKNYREIIGGFHMWGKLKKDGRWIPHAGNFDTFFSNDNELKQEFLKSVSSTFNDGIVRYFVPEVNSSQNDLHSIVADMEETGFIFLFKNKSTNNKKFNDFHIWDIKIPEKNIEYRESGFFEKRGWLIQFCFGEKNGKEYMDVYYSHRMTNDRHDRIYEDGTGESLQAFPDFYPIDPDDPVNNKKLEEENNKMINEIKNNLREKGFYPFPDVNNLVSNINNYIKNNM